MNQQRDANDDDDQELVMRQVLALSGQLQRRFQDVLNDPADAWVEQPCVASHAAAETLGGLLAFVVSVDPNRLHWAIDLLDYVRGHVEAASFAGVVPGERRH